ncbi:MAG: GtrA family protein [Eubacteriales bacterium]|nr:GtrA family protein [Eubacteriales bacterium]
MSKLQALLEKAKTEKTGFWPTALQFIKFGVVGLSNTLISLTIYYLFVWIDPSLYLWGNVVGWVVSVLNAFYWSNRVVFRSDNNSKKELALRLLKSYISYGSTFLLSSLILWLEVQHWGVSEWLAPIVNLLITIPLNFLINKFWTFKK